ncbi:hypothetical protein AGMMS49574_27010 [Bacteroidia bacterium]|nr:hypothetical protein AGMMS49574_27010 [Bacteroidia bacterium]
MQIINQTYHWLDRFNSLVKLQLKINVESYIGVDDYIRYVEFDYTKYKPSFRWDFGKNTPEDYKDLSALPRFNRLVYLLCHILYVKDIEKEKRTSPLPIELVAEISEDSRKPKEQADDYVLDISGKFRFGLPFSKSQ